MHLKSFLLAGLLTFIRVQLAVLHLVQHFLQEDSVFEQVLFKILTLMPKEAYLQKKKQLLMFLNEAVIQHIW